MTGPWQSILLVQTTSSTSRKRLLATTGSIITFWCRALGSNTSTSRRHFRASRQLFLQFATRWLAISIVEDGAHGVGSVHWLQTARAVGGGQCSVRARLDWGPHSGIRGHIAREGRVGDDVIISIGRFRLLFSCWF